MRRSPRLVVIGGEAYERPAIRAHCEPGGPLHFRPCPYVACKYHLVETLSPITAQHEWLAVDGRKLKPNATAGEVERFTASAAEFVVRARATCALDAARHEHTLEEVAVMLELTRERIRQIEAKALRKLPKRARAKLGVAPSDYREPKHKIEPSDDAITMSGFLSGRRKQ